MSCFDLDEPHGIHQSTSMFFTTILPARDQATARFPALGAFATFARPASRSTWNEPSQASHSQHDRGSLDLEAAHSRRACPDSGSRSSAGATRPPGPMSSPTVRWTATIRVTWCRERVLECDLEYPLRHLELVHPRPLSAPAVSTHTRPRPRRLGSCARAAESSVLRRNEGLRDAPLA